MSGSCVNKIVLLMSEENGETSWRRQKGNRRSNNQTKVCRTHPALKQVDRSSKRPHLVSLLSAKNWRLRLQFTQIHQHKHSTFSESLDSKVIRSH